MKTTMNILTAGILAAAMLAAVGNQRLFADQPQSELKAASLPAHDESSGLNANPPAAVVIKILLVKSGKVREEQARPDPRLRLHSRAAPAPTRFMRN